MCPPRPFQAFCECLLLWGVPPLLLWASGWHFIFVYPLVLAAAFVLVRPCRRFWPALPASRQRGEAAQLRLLLGRFSICALLLLAIAWYYLPDWLLAFPRRDPGRWLLVMLLYPLLSAAPQEMIFRVLLVRRWSRLFATRRALLLVSALGFAWLHLFYDPWAVILSLPAGWFFAQTYLDSRSFRLAWLEHALYGNFLFTIGIGRLFYNGH